MSKRPSLETYWARFSHQSLRLESYTNPGSLHHLDSYGTDSQKSFHGPSKNPWGPCL